MIRVSWAELLAASAVLAAWAGFLYLCWWFG